MVAWSWFNELTPTMGEVTPGEWRTQAMALQCAKSQAGKLQHPT